MMQAREAYAIASLWLLASTMTLAVPADAGESPPLPGPARPFVIPPATTLALRNGLRATFVRYGRVPKVTISIRIRAGEIDAPGHTWLAKLSGAMLREGTLHGAGKDVADAAALIGGTVVVDVNADETSVSIDVLARFAPQAVNLLGTLVTDPAFPADELPRIRDNLSRALHVQRSQQWAAAYEVFGAKMYPNHSYGETFPTEAQLQSYSITDVRNFHAENFGAARSHIYAVGQFDSDTLQAAIETSFGSWLTGVARTDRPVPASARPSIHVVDRPGALQSTLRIGVRVITPSHPDFQALSLVDVLLGGALTSRITMNLREGRGWSYSPGSSLSVNRRAAVWVEHADVQNEVTGAALREIVREIQRLRNEPPTNGELTALKNYQSGTFALSAATRIGLIRELASADLHGLPSDSVSTFSARLYAISPERIMQVARDYLDPKAMTIVVVGDMKVVGPQVSERPIDASR